MAIAEAQLAALFNRPGHAVVDHYTFFLASDGDLMEGISHEACSLAGHLKLGKLCTEGKEAADYLWQVPKDEAMRQKILDLLEQIAVESAKQGRKEMPRICEELKTAAQASASPQQVDILVNGFDRLVHLWQAAKSGLL